MDAKITLSFNKQTIDRAKRYAESQNMSLSRLMELILDKITTKQYLSLEDFPISEWVHEIAEGKAEYITKQKSRATVKSQYRNRKK